jgi:hypothetical protein
VCCERTASFMVRKGYRKTTLIGGLRWHYRRGSRLG